jgi:outer membrane protein OmpA-like peptidoglycan-associated protein
VTAPKKLTITVYFKGDSAVLTSATKVALKKLAVQAKANGKASSITIIGRVKETNDKSYDKRLSTQRAVNVAKYLKQLGVVGTYKVIAAGISPENKPISRRVDGVLIWK